MAMQGAVYMSVTSRDRGSLGGDQYLYMFKTDIEEL